MREHQRKAVAAFEAAGRVGILSIPCGGGKTVIALKIAATVGRRTLIVLHKDFLIAQWRERISMFLPGASVGLIKASKTDVAGRDIVLASLQSLSMKDYPDDLFQDFGLLIVDEVHRSGTEVFFNALKKTSMAATLGLSATLRRKDGMERVFKAYVGEIVYEITRQDLDAAAADDDGFDDVTTVQQQQKKKKKKTIKAFGDLSLDSSDDDDGGDSDDDDEKTRGRGGGDASTVLVQMVYYSNAAPEYSGEVFIEATGKINLSRMINNVCEFPGRIDFVCDLISNVLVAEPRRRALVLCDRKQLLRAIASRLDAAGGVHRTGFYIGGMKQDALKASEGADVILATFSFASEGFDVPGLDTLFLLSPKSDVEQAVGRILRQEAGKRTTQPKVFDLVDNFSVFLGQARKRRAFYKSQGYKLGQFRMKL